MRPFYAHSCEGKPTAEWELLGEHLHLVAEGDERLPGAAGFASAFGGRECGRVLGLWHDLGKYSLEFQRYLQSAGSLEAHLETQAGRVDHSTAGAQHAAGRGDAVGRILAYCIAGHHAGLPDAVDTSGGRSSLNERLNRSVPAVGGAPPELLAEPVPDPPKLKCAPRQVAFQVAFLGRMLFSCLVDADYLATEAFMRPEAARERRHELSSLAELRAGLDDFLATKQASAADTSVNRKRREVLQACLAAAVQEPGLFSLTVPTGGGKTLSSLAFALKHAEMHQLRRVIYAIPFTSIIEQNTDVYREALGPLGRGAILEHHSNLDLDREDRWARLAAENWDAPLVVTTNVQLFESLFANRPSICRKLHRMARSVIVLDEAQTLPVDLLKPSLAALEELCRNYGCSVVLCSATQPAVMRREDFSIGLRKVREIMPDYPALYTALKRVAVEPVGKLSDDELVENLARHDQVLCVVNTRRHAATLFEALRTRAGGECLHLSAQMCPAHRSAVLRLIRMMLRRGRPCRVISTQLVEAGVDVDFPVVYRAMTGLDSIAQAAGRCNREGRLECGRVVVFEAEASSLPSAEQAAQDTREILPDHEDLLSLEAIRDYFELHYWKRQDQWDARRVMECFQKGGHHLQYRQAAEQYRLIRDQRQPVIIPYGRRGRVLVEQLRRMAEPPGRGFHRRLQRYVVGLYERDYRRLLDNQAARVYPEPFDRFCVLDNPKAYDKLVGLRLDVVGFDPSGLIQ